MNPRRRAGALIIATALGTLPNRAIPEPEIWQLPMLGAQAQYSFGIHNTLRITLGSTVQTPGVPMLLNLDSDAESVATGLTYGRFLPLTGLTWSSDTGLSPLLLGVAVERGSALHRTLAEAGSGGINFAWIAGGIALAGGALSAGGGGGGGSSGAADNANSTSGGTQLHNPAGNPTGGDCHTAGVIAGSNHASQCTQQPPEPADSAVISGFSSLNDAAMQLPNP